jgi:hypothetical protein
VVGETASVFGEGVTVNVADAVSAVTIPMSVPDTTTE